MHMRYRLRSSLHFTISMALLLVILYWFSGTVSDGIRSLLSLVNGGPFRVLDLISIGLAAAFITWLAWPCQVTLTDKALRIIHGPTVQYLPLAKITEAKLPPLGRIRVDRFAHRWGLTFAPASFDRAPAGLVLVKAGFSWYGLRLAEPERFLADLNERLAQQRSAG